MSFLDTYLKQVDSAKHADFIAIHKIIEQATGLQPAHNHTTSQYRMVGYGPYHYKYASGREGDWFAIGLASNKTGFSIYISAVEKDRYIAEKYRTLLGKASVGKSCIRFKKLSDLNTEILTQAIKEGYEVTKKTYLK